MNMLGKIQFLKTITFCTR